MKYLNEEIEFDDFNYLRETLNFIVNTLDKESPAYKKAEELQMELNQDIREAEDEFVENNICSICGGEIKPRLAYRGTGVTPFDPDYWPDEYVMVCEDCGEDYG